MQLVSFFVLDKPKFDELCVIAKPMATLKAKKQERVVLQVVPPHCAKEETDVYLELWDFLYENGSAPFEYKWSGSMLAILMVYLSTMHGVDLSSSTWDTGDESWIWYLFDTKVQHSYLERLRPARYDESEISEWLKKNGFNDSPELRTGMLDGICVFHQYISMLDDNFVVLFRIGSVEP